MTGLATYGHDYPDRMNPFLVKELRAGLRTPGYLAVFLSLLLALTVFTLATADSPGAADYSASVVKVVLSLAVALIMPLTAYDALFSERRGRRLEPLVLSPVTARQVVRGKWCVIALQSSLLVAVTSPFMVLQYFSGGVNIVENLAVSLIALGAGLTTSAFVLCASGLLRENNTLVNAIVRLGSGFVLLYGGSWAAGLLFILGFFARMELWKIAPLIFLGCLVVAFVLLEVAALTLGSNFGSPMRKSDGGVPPPIPGLARRRDSSATSAGHAP